MRVYRQAIEIKAQILKACQTPLTLTQLLMKIKSFGGYYTKYLKELENLNLLKKEGKTYRTTEKGLKWLNIYQQLQQLEQPTLPEAADWKEN